MKNTWKESLIITFYKLHTIIFLKCFSLEWLKWKMCFVCFYLKFIDTKVCSLQIKFKDLFLLADWFSDFGTLRCSSSSKYVELWNAVNADLHRPQRRQMSVSVIRVLLSFSWPICLFICNYGNFSEIKSWAHFLLHLHDCPECCSVTLL